MSGLPSPCPSPGAATLGREERKKLVALLDRGCRVRPAEAQAEAEEAAGLCEGSKSTTSTWPEWSREKARGTRHPEQNRQWALPLRPWPGLGCG